MATIQGNARGALLYGLGLAQMNRRQGIYIKNARYVFVLYMRAIQFHPKCQKDNALV
jgi:hypothetical protein